MEVKLNVKDKSVFLFLTERLLDYDPEIKGGCGPRGFDTSSAYYLLKDEMLFKQGFGITIGETVRIELLDRTQNSGKGLTNIYVYKAEVYDDIAIKMVLIDFKIEPEAKEEEKQINLVSGHSSTK